MIADLIKVNRRRRRFDEHHDEAKVHNIPKHRLEDIIIAPFDRF